MLTYTLPKLSLDKWQYIYDIYEIVVRIINFILFSPLLASLHITKMCPAMIGYLLTGSELVIMVALWNRADHYIFILSFVMVALWNRADHYIFILSFVLLSFYLLSFSSPNLSHHRLYVCHTSTHGVPLVRI